MIRIDCNKIIKKQHNFWNHIHFHPTDAIEDDWGRNILDQVAADGVAKTVRMYAMLEDIVSMDEKGNLQYDYTECDARIDYLLSKGFNLLLSYNFIPKCIAIDPDEGTSNAKKKLRYKNKTICASPPKDYALWDEICYEFTRHIVDRYGEEEVSKWYLQCFNEPDITAFFMKYEPDPMVRVGEYLKLYRGFSKGIRRVSEKLKAGGPAMAHNGIFLVEFLKAVKAENLKMDYFCGHSYGTTPKNLNDGSGRFHVLNNLKKIEFYYRLLKTSGMEDMPIVIDEWGASTHGFFNREECPMLMLREDSRFAAYFGNLITSLAFGSLPVSMLMICLSGQHEMEVDFSGFRGFFTLNGIKKPIYNAYVLSGKLHENILVSENPVANLEILPTADEDGNVSVMLSYASEYYDRQLPDLAQTLTFEGLQGDYTVKLWCIDQTHTNPYTRMLREGMQEDGLTAEQIAILKDEGCLKPVSYGITANGSATVDVACSNNACLLVELRKTKE